MPRSLLTRRNAVIALGALAAIAAPALAYAAKVRDRTEKPKYEVLAKHEVFEVRRYAPRIVAEVKVEGSAKDATSDGFRLLADFIFGNNTTGTKVAMTAPVDRTATSEKIAMTAPVDRTQDGTAWTVAFTMPSAFTLETLPRPNNPRVKIRELPPKRYAVSRFSGMPKEEVVQQRMDTLRKQVEDEGYPLAGKAPVYARYDPPWTPGFLRRNEILIELAPEETP